MELNKRANGSCEACIILDIIRCFSRHASAYATGIKNIWVVHANVNKKDLPEIKSCIEEALHPARTRKSAENLAETEKSKKRNRRKKRETRQRENRQNAEKEKSFTTQPADISKN